MQGEGSKNCAVLDTPANLAGMYFWANGIDWNTEKTEDLDAVEKFLVNEFATHIKAFDSYPSDKIAEGAYSWPWCGTAMPVPAYPKIDDAGGNVDDWVWGLGAPPTELWMDNYCIPTGAPNPDAAHAWINWILIPEVSIKDLDFHGYNSGMKNMGQLLKELKPDLKYGDMIFFNDEQVKTMRTQVITRRSDRLVDILQQGQGCGRGVMSPGRARDESEMTTTAPVAAHGPAGLDGRSAAPAGDRGHRRSHSPFRRSSGTLFFFILPILLIVWYSFGVKNTASGTGVPVTMGNKTLQNYRDAFSPTFFTVFKSTLKISILATTLCFVFGFPVAYFLVFKITEKWKGILLALVVVPSFTSFLIRTLAWRIPLAANGELSK